MLALFSFFARLLLILSRRKPTNLELSYILTYLCSRNYNWSDGFEDQKAVALSWASAQAEKEAAEGVGDIPTAKASARRQGTHFHVGDNDDE